MELDLTRISGPGVTKWALVTAPHLGDTIDPSEPIVYDIETGPLDDEALAAAIEPFPEYTPLSTEQVKTGNLKDEQKIRDKVTQAIAEHREEYHAKKAKHEAEFRERAALSPLTGRVLAIGYADPSGRCLIHGAEEESLLTQFWGLYRQMSSQSVGGLIGWNSNSFDLPFIVRRCWLYDIPIPQDALNGRYWSKLLVDLLDVWRLGAKDYVSLDRVARYFGLGGKNGSGALFYQLWKNDRDEACRYLANDLDLTLGVAKRLGVV